MPRQSETARVAAEWVQKAESDVLSARHLLKIKAGCPTDAVCFHAQQCVEKYVKALLVVRNVDFPRTHDIGELIALLCGRPRFGLPPDEERRLTGYATVARYPSGYDPIPLTEARRPVRLARQVRREARRLLPPGALQPGRT
ncbi:MAG: HEPN domain-containing protein [Planctomycetes bacterium]|nr:HEPN domain-containing protein [Planctomycetota bacterium]